MTEAASQALAILRDGSQFQWYVIPLLALVFYVYTVEVQKRSWDLVFPSRKRGEGDPAPSFFPDRERPPVRRA